MGARNSSKAQETPHLSLETEEGDTFRFPVVASFQDLEVGDKNDEQAEEQLSDQKEEEAEETLEQRKNEGDQVGQEEAIGEGARQ